MHVSPEMVRHESMMPVYELSMKIFSRKNPERDVLLSIVCSTIANRHRWLKAKSVLLLEGFYEGKGGPPKSSTRDTMWLVTRS